MYGCACVSICYSVYSVHVCIIRCMYAVLAHTHCERWDTRMYTCASVINVCMCMQIFCVYLAHESACVHTQVHYTWSGKHVVCMYKCTCQSCVSVLYESGLLSPTTHQAVCSQCWAANDFNESAFWIHIFLIKYITLKPNLWETLIRAFVDAFCGGVFLLRSTRGRMLGFI